MRLLAVFYAFSQQMLFSVKFLGKVFSVECFPARQISLRIRP